MALKSWTGSKWHPSCHINVTLHGPNKIFCFLPNCHLLFRWCSVGEVFSLLRKEKKRVSALRTKTAIDAWLKIIWYRSQNRERYRESGTSFTIRYNGHRWADKDCRKIVRTCTEAYLSFSIYVFEWKNVTRHVRPPQERKAIQPPTSEIGANFYLSTILQQV